jgi:hypothetical protein
MALLALAAASAPRAIADQNWKTSTAIWKGVDSCTRAARKQFPDHTAEANAKREAARQQCLRGSNLPGEANPTPHAAAQH